MDEKEVANLRQKYRLDVVLSRPEFPVATTYGKIDGKEADPKNIESYWRLLWSEWNLYPPELVEKTALKRIILCEDLKFGTQPRSALPDYEHHDLYLDVTRGHDSGDALYVHKVMHHEFFHMIDWCADQDKDEDGWTALNPPWFKYGEGGETQQKDSHTSELSEANPGFLNKYSTSGLIEDKAEIFAHMVVDRKVVDHRGDAAIINKKMQKMEELLRGFCPQVDEHFWDVAGKVERLGTAA